MEVSFSPIAASGKPLSRCGKCHRFMKYIQVRRRVPARCHHQKACLNISSSESLTLALFNITIFKMHRGEEYTYINTRRLFKVWQSNMSIKQNQHISQYFLDYNILDDVTKYLQILNYECKNISIWVLHVSIHTTVCLQIFQNEVKIISYFSL